MNIQQIDIHQIEDNPNFQIRDRKTDRNRLYYQKQKNLILQKRKEKYAEIQQQNQQLLNQIDSLRQQNQQLLHTIQSVRNLLGNVIIFEAPSSC